jgi:hypothetical protein
MYSIIGILFCILEGVLVAKFGWVALLWSSVGFIFGLFAAANMFLPILMGVPMASSHISKKEMRPAVFLALFRAPIIWAIVFLFIGWIFPSAVNWVSKNETLCIGLAFGSIAILFTPISKKGRTDFRSDFNKSYGRYYTDQDAFQLNFTSGNDKTQLKQINAAITVASNLYYHDFKNSFDVLKLQFPDSRFRCLVFSLSATVKSVEDLLKSPELLQKDCLHFLSNVATSKENSKEFFDHQTSPEQAELSGAVYLDAYNETWKFYYEAIERGDNVSAIDVLCSIIHSIETGDPLDNSDRERLGQLCWQIDFSLTNNTMREAFIAMTSK